MILFWLYFSGLSNKVIRVSIYSLETGASLIRLQTHWRNWTHLVYFLPCLVGEVGCVCVGGDGWGRVVGRMLHVCIPEHQASSEKASILKGKNLLPCRANSFLIEWRLFKREARTSWLSFTGLIYTQTNNYYTHIVKQMMMMLMSTTTNGRWFMKWWW